MQLIRQNTAASVLWGPLVDYTAGQAPVTGITPAANDVVLIPNQAVTGTDLSTRTISHVAQGLYSINLTAADTATAGQLNIVGAKSGSYRPARGEYMVLPQPVFDSLITGSVKLPVDVEQIGTNPIAAFLSGTSQLRADVEQIAGNSTAAANLSASALGITVGTAQAGGTASSFRTNLPQTVNGFFVGRIVVFTTGVLAGQASTVIAYTGATATLSVAGFTAAPSNGDSFVIL